MLSLEIEFLSGVCYAKDESGRAEYPPQADRMFSALVATWAARGRRSAERAALEWLEERPSPRIAASEYFARDSVDVFVPVNDSRTATKGDPRVLPGLRGRQPRRFPAAIPLEPRLYFEWDDEPTLSIFEALAAIAADVSYVGHSASLVRASFQRTKNVASKALIAARSPYAGRLAELEAAFTRRDRPSAGGIAQRSSVSLQSAPTAPTTTVFSPQWIVLPSVATPTSDARAEGNFIPDARATAFVSKRLRDAIMSTFGTSGKVVPEWISGHRPDGAPTSNPHLAIVPMLDVGHSHATGNLMGLAAVPPNGVEGSDIAVIKALMHLRVRTTSGEQPQIGLRFAHGCWRLALTDDDERPSLAAARYLAARGARRWATVTPIALDRHPKARSAAARTAEVEEILALAATHIGLPRPESVVAAPYSAFAGAAPSRASTGAPPWTGWALTGALGQRLLTHAVLSFQEPVSGPVLLGAGRYLGLGLCRPLGEESRRG